MTYYQHLYVRVNDDERHGRVHINDNGFIVADAAHHAPAPTPPERVVDNLVGIVEEAIEQERLDEATLVVLTFCESDAAVELLATFREGCWYDMSSPDEPVSGWHVIRQQLVGALVNLVELNTEAGRMEAPRGA